MEKLIELNIDPSILVSSTILNAKRPDYVYIPLLEDSTILIHNEDKVKIGTPIIKRGNKEITSPVSGKVTSIKKVSAINYKAIDAIEIMNDFEERTKEDPKNIKLGTLKKEQLDKILASFQIDLNNKENFILNCIDDEPYVLTENFYLFSEHVEFLELLDKLSKEYMFKQVIITIKATSSNNINQLMNHLGMYTNITLNIVPNLYLLGNPQFLTKHLGLEEDNTIVIDASNFYHINNYIKRKKTITDKLITISGNNIEKPTIIKAKIGSVVKEIISDIIKENDSSLYIGNGLMHGNHIDLNSIIVTEDLKSILIMKEENQEKTGNCISCGACINICPVGINPLLLNKKEYRNTIKDICLKCGLCSYICPVYINFNKEWNGDNIE